MSNSNPVTLEDKRSLVHARFDEIVERWPEEAGSGRVAVAWTAGKDSTLALWLWKEWLARTGRAASVPLRALCIDTGVKFPEVVALRERLAAEWNVDLALARPEVDIDAYPVAEDKVACCRDLKIAPLKKAIVEQGFAVLVTGLRRDEHPSRAARPWLEARTDPAHHMAHVMAEFTEMDVWAATTQHAVPYCSLYNAGYRSLGCVPCTEKPASGERSGRHPDKERALADLHSLGYF